MNRYLSKKTIKKLMIVGGSMFIVSLVLNFTTVFSIYGKVDECLVKSTGCTLGTERVAGKIAMVIGYVGIGVFIIGLVLLLIELAKKKKL